MVYEALWWCGWFFLDGLCSKIRVFSQRLDSWYMDCLFIVLMIWAIAGLIALIHVFLLGGIIIWVIYLYCWGPMYCWVPLVLDFIGVGVWLSLCLMCGWCFVGGMCFHPRPFSRWPLTVPDPNKDGIVAWSQESKCGWFSGSWCFILVNKWWFKV